MSTKRKFTVALLYPDYMADDDVPPLVTCQICGKPTNALTAHLHGDGYIGDDCCWDERLRGLE